MTGDMLINLDSEDEGRFLFRVQEEEAHVPASTLNAKRLMTISS